MILEYSILKVELPEKTTFIGEMLRQAREKLDSSIVVDLENKFEGLEALSGRLLVWKAELIEIPGHAHVHEDGEECTHDHAKDALLEGMSDEDILKIQQDQQSELLGIREDLIALDLPV